MTIKREMDKCEPVVENVVRFLIQRGYESVEESNELMEKHKKRVKAYALKKNISEYDSEVIHFGFGEDALAVHKLRDLQHYFRAALDVAERFEIGTRMTNFIVRDYAERFSKTTWVTRGSSLPAPDTIIGFIKLGASSKVMELVLKEYVRAGYRKKALELAALLGRKLTENEIQVLVDEYLDGASRSNEDDWKLGELALSHLPKEKARAIIERISRTRKEFDSAIL